MLRIISISLVLLLSSLSVKANRAEDNIIIESKYSKHTEAATKILMQKCRDCHTSYTEYPFYAQLPIIKDVIEKDVLMGKSYVNFDRQIFTKKDDSEIDTVVLNRIKDTLVKNSMPPFKYKMIHWDKMVSASDREIILAWISDLSTSSFEPVPDPKSFNLPEAKVELGEQLFHDKRLSRNNSLSCASCHNLELGGTDQRQYSVGVGNTEGHINSPTVLNSRYNIKQFWDGRADTLEAQAHGPVHNPGEMGSSWPEVINKLRNDNNFMALFKSAYGDNQLSGDRFAEAIATYEKTLVTPNSKFDQYLQGNTLALSSEEKEGFELFKKYNCNNCHAGVALGGTGFQKMGIAKNYFEDRAVGLNGLPPIPLSKEDLGRFNFTSNPADKHVFKVPILRNIKDTFPYMHDGGINTLYQAVDIMAEYQLGKELPSEEIDKIVKFLQTL